MAKQIKKKIRNEKSTPSPFNFYWKKENAYLLGLGMVILVLGFFLMSIDPFDSFPSLTLSPIVLLLAYLVVFPLSILYRKKNKVEQEK
ncbi:MAG: hypothetical protein JEY94_02990 [Melioribacteraceae bacterium]|nr:hypothetical protein [Melioribacteraceae bacterium]